MTVRAFALFIGLLVVVPLAQAAPAAKSSAKSAAKPASPAQKTVTRSGGASEASIKAYCNRVWQKLNNNWMVPDGNNHVTLTVSISSDGSLGDISAVSTPKNNDAEAAALTALERSKPLDLLPSGMGNGKLTVTFNSKADPHGDSESGGSVRLDPVN